MSPRTVHLLKLEAFRRQAEDADLALAKAIRIELEQPEAKAAAVRYLFPVKPTRSRAPKSRPVVKCDCGCGERQTG